MKSKKIQSIGIPQSNPPKDYVSTQCGFFCTSFCNLAVSVRMSWPHMNDIKWYNAKYKHISTNHKSHQTTLSVQHNLVFILEIKGSSGVSLEIAQILKFFWNFY